MAALVSKEKVVSALNKRANECEEKSRQTEKALLKGELDLKSGLKQYIKQRSDYHQNQILKVKVSQSWCIYQVQ